MSKMFLSYALISILAANIYFILSIYIRNIVYKNEVLTVSKYVVSLAKVFFSNCDINEENLKLCRNFIINNLEEDFIAYKFKTLSCRIVRDRTVEITFILKDLSEQLIVRKISILKNYD